MAKATATIREALCYQPQHAHYFAENATLFNRVVAFYFDCIQAHDGILALKNKEALTALERLTHATEANPHPIMPLFTLAPDIPAMFRRAAINAALGSARSFFSSLKKWRLRKEKYEAKQSRKGKQKRPFRGRPPVPPRTWNRSVPLYAGQWKERSGSSILLKVWTGTCWSWIKVHTLSRDLPNGYTMQSPALVRRGKQWWLHTPIEKTFTAPPKIAEQVTSTDTKICAVDLNINEHIAVCTVQTVEGTIIATRFIGGGRAIAGFRKHLLVLRSLNAITKEATIVAMILGRASPDPGLRPQVELSSSNAGGLRDLLGRGLALPDQRITAEEAPPPLLQIEPTCPSRDEDVVDARMLFEPSARLETVMEARDYR